jgi:hypothetical protein
MTRNSNLKDALRGAADAAQLVEIFGAVTMPGLKARTPAEERRQTIHASIARN